ncbi:MAG: hypothetical protein OXE77_10110 [Flavobacteriaceae bacterium]|nr:hypothetical protein [Flavobacteriaceae bacterium]MCY4268020.1 hypothetical protein [Flavobacteriaceae bacterium]MCY4298861.1 hypothetical protein [Flavobacteriaceae bacterium]
MNRGLMFMLLGSFLSFGQSQTGLEVKVDTTELKIGELLNLTLELTIDSLAEVEFPANPRFAPFEVIEESLLDTIKAQSHYTFVKKYGLIQFDSGNYIIPQQAVFVNGFIQVSDSIPIRVNTVVVDTLQQPMFDIKPFVEMSRNYDRLIRIILYVLLGLFVLAGMIHTYVFNKQQKKLQELGLSPFEKALKDLKKLETQQLASQKDYKEFYTQLVDILRHYLDNETDIDALESTSRELLDKLNQYQKDKKLPLDSQWMDSLERALNNADMVKFARMQLNPQMAQSDKELVQTTVIDVREALPEPTEEELKETQAFQITLAKKKKKQQLIYGLSSFFGLLVIGLVISMLVYGYYPVRDTLLGYPTKRMMQSDWIQSEYGWPSVQLTTPQVLIRQETAKQEESFFELGVVGDRFYSSLYHGPFDPEIATDQDSIAQPNGELFIEKVSDQIQELGGRNIFIDGNQISLPKGDQALSIEGRFDFGGDAPTQTNRYDFTVILILFEQRQINLKMIYPSDDRYASEIKNRILESFEIQNQAEP